MLQPKSDIEAESETDNDSSDNSDSDGDFRIQRYELRHGKMCLQGVCRQRKPKPACAAVQPDQDLQKTLATVDYISIHERP